MTARTAIQVHLLPLDGPGEARRLTDLPRGRRRASPGRPTGAGWPCSARPAARAARRTPDGGAAPPTIPAPGSPPPSDYHYLDRLRSMLNGAGFVYPIVQQLWIVEVETRRGPPADRPGGLGREPDLVPGRDPDRVRGRPRPGPRPALAERHPRRRRRDRRPDADHRRRRSSGPRPGCPTAGTWPSSGTGSRPAAAAATTSGSSRPTGPTTAAMAGGTCRVGTT